MSHHLLEMPRVSSKRRLSIGALAAAAITFCSGCGTHASRADGRLAQVHGLPGRWDVWIPSYGHHLYVRERETGDLLTPPCPGPPWGAVSAYRRNNSGHFVLSTGMDPVFKSALERATRRAQPAPKPKWMKIYEQRCTAGEARSLTI